MFGGGKIPEAGSLRRVQFRENTLVLTSEFYVSKPAPLQVHS
jgi:hypothetical protein